LPTQRQDGLRDEPAIGARLRSCEGGLPERSTELGWHAFTFDDLGHEFERIGVQPSIELRCNGSRPSTIASPSGNSVTLPASTELRAQPRFADFRRDSFHRNAEGRL
jgi:hypothetical protein